MDDRRVNRDRQNVEEADEFEQEDNCPQRELEDEMRSRMEWTKGSWEGRVVRLLTREWEKRVI